MLPRILTQIRNNAVAYVALFIALSGTAFAASSGPASPVRRARVARHTRTEAARKRATAARRSHSVSGRCPTGQAIQAVSKRGRISCASTGTITGVVAGTGLTGGGSSGSVVVAVNPKVVQARVAGACGAGHAIASIKPQGSVACRAAEVSQLMGGTGTATLSAGGDFMAPVGVSTPSPAIHAVEVGSSNAPSRARGLFVNVLTAPASGASWTFDLYVDGAEKTAMKCVITGPASSCHAKGSAAIPKGARVALHETGAGSPAATTATFGWTDTIF